MATTKTIQATVKNRTDTAANWTQKNPVLAEGEIIVVQTNAGETRLKIGDGVKTFTQLPYTDEQIYNNVVTSVNGQTGDVTTNSVEYTQQTLTDEQKKQVRENIGAIDAANGLLPVKCILPSGLNTTNKTVFVKNGVMLPLDYSTATEDMKKAIFRFSLLLNSSNMTPDIIDASVEAFATLIKNGIFGNDFYGSYTWPSNMLYIYDSQFSPKTVISMWSYYSASDSRKGFTLCVTKANGNTFTRAYNITASAYANNYIEYTSIPLAAYASESGDTPSIQQVEMKAVPTKDMEIATKKYIDDKISDKELILSSSTVGSTKKFKLTIDDTGTLTASEITA